MTTVAIDRHTIGCDLVPSISAAVRFPVGSHFAVPCAKTSCTNRFYWHHMIFLGKSFNDHLTVREHMRERRKEYDEDEDALVVHMMPDGNIAFDTLSCAAGMFHRSLQCINHGDPDLAACVSRAFDAYMQHGGDVYDVMKSNCEHFAVYCITGRCDLCLLTECNKVLDDVEISFASPKHLTFDHS